MNTVILMGRLTRNPDVRWSQGQEQKCTARYTLAVDRRTKAADGGSQADFISCIAFGTNAEFAEKYLKQGTKVVITGRLNTGSYTNKEGQRVYTADVVIASQEFAESKAAGQHGSLEVPTAHSGITAEDGFMQLPIGVEEDGLPFN